MGDELVPTTGDGLAAAHGRHTEADFRVSGETVRRMERAVPEKTRQAYEYQWRLFTGWCAATGRVARPATAETVAEYVTSLCALDRAPATIEQALAVILSFHRGHQRPETRLARLVLQEHQRARADAGRRQRTAAPAVVDTVLALVGQCDLATAKGLRDRVIIVLGFAMMARRSTLAKLQISDLRFVDEGLVVLVRSSKTDQAGVGREVHIPCGSRPATCPVTAVRAWLDHLTARGVTEGLLLQGLDKAGTLRGGVTGEAINKVVKRLAAKAGLANADLLTAHSLRAGGATAAASNGVPVSVIAEHGGWNPRSPVVHGYIRSTGVWDDNAMNGVL